MRGLLDCASPSWSAVTWVRPSGTRGLLPAPLPHDRDGELDMLHRRAGKGIPVGLGHGHHTLEQRYGLFFGLVFPMRHASLLAFRRSSASSSRGSPHSQKSVPDHWPQISAL
jgi:hypothetical protein